MFLNEYFLFVSKISIKDFVPLKQVVVLIKLIINEVLDLHTEMFTDEILFFIWSDSCAAQFRSRFVFYLIARIDKNLKVEWCYDERHHGKGAMEGIGCTIKKKFSVM